MDGETSKVPEAFLAERMPTNSQPDPVLGGNVILVAQHAAEFSHWTMIKLSTLSIFLLYMKISAVRINEQPIEFLNRSSPREFVIQRFSAMPRDNLIECSRKSFLHITIDLKIRDPERNSTKPAVWKVFRREEMGNVSLVTRTL